MSIDVYLMKVKDGWVSEMYWLGQSGVTDKLSQGNAKITKIEGSESVSPYKVDDVESIKAIIEECDDYHESFSYMGGLDNKELVEVLSDEGANYQILVV